MIAGNGKLKRGWRLDYFGNSVAISGDYAVVSAHGEDNSSTSIDNTDNGAITDAGTADGSGAVYVFKRDVGTGNWIQDAYLKASNAEAGDWFRAVSISGDYIVVGATREDNSSNTIDNVDNNPITDTGTATDSGAVYVFKRDAGTGNWIQDAYLKPSNTGAGDNFGGQQSANISIDGNYVAVASPTEDNSSTAIDNVDNNPVTDAGTATDSGAVYIFKRDAWTGNWIQDAYLKPSNAEAGDAFSSVSISGDYVIVGAAREDNDASLVVNKIDNIDNNPVTDIATAADSGAAYIFKKAW